MTSIDRTMRVLLDLLTVKFLGDYVSKPLYLFGKLASSPLVSRLLRLAWPLFRNSAT